MQRIKSLALCNAGTPATSANPVAWHSHCNHQRVVEHTQRLPAQARAVVCCAQRSKADSKKRQAAKEQSRRTKLVARQKQQRQQKRSRDKQQRDESPRWRFLAPKAYAQAEGWDVPWGWPTIVAGTAGWGVSFVLTGILTVPIAIFAFKINNFNNITALQQSQIQLADQVRVSLMCQSCQSCFIQ